jgi:hypothetical protein
VASQVCLQPPRIVQFLMQLVVKRLEVLNGRIASAPGANQTKKKKKQKPKKNNRKNIKT